MTRWRRRYGRKIFNFVRATWTRRERATWVDSSCYTAACFMAVFDAIDISNEDCGAEADSRRTCEIWLEEERSLTLCCNSCYKTSFLVLPINCYTWGCRLTVVHDFPFFLRAMHICAVKNPSRSTLVLVSRNVHPSNICSVRNKCSEKKLMAAYGALCRTWNSSWEQGWKAPLLLFLENHCKILTDNEIKVTK